MRETVMPTLDEHGHETHPAWGLLVVTRGQGTPQSLFDSDIKHQHTVNLSLHSVRRQRDLHRDWIGTGKTKFELQLSESQWAELVSSVGQGSGTSCTIRFDMSQDDPFTPDFPVESRLKESADEVKQAARRAIENVVEKLEAVEAKPNKGNIRALRSAVDNLPSNLSFAADSLTEHTEKVVLKARADIEAMAMHAAQQRGLDPGEFNSTPLLGSGEED
jgi:hypothetical protein